MPSRRAGRRKGDCIRTCCTRVFSAVPLPYVTSNYVHMHMQVHVYPGVLSRAARRGKHFVLLSKESRELLLLVVDSKRRSTAGMPSSFTPKRLARRQLLPPCRPQRQPLHPATHGGVTEISTNTHLRDNSMEAKPSGCRQQHTTELPKPNQGVIPDFKPPPHGLDGLLLDTGGGQYFVDAQETYSCNLDGNTNCFTTRPLCFVLCNHLSPACVGFALSLSLSPIWTLAGASTERDTAAT